MGGYGLEIGELRRAAAAARSAGEQLATLEVGCRIDGAVGALRGSKSGALLRVLEGSWGLQGQEYSSSLLDHATKLTAAAGDYAADDAKAAEAFKPVHVGGQREFL